MSSPKQVAFITDLAKKKVVPPEFAAYVTVEYAETLDNARVDGAIKWLKSLPWQPKGQPAAPGYYEHDGDVYFVKETKNKRMFAMRLVVSQTSDGKAKGRYVPAPGMVFNLPESALLDADQAQMLSKQYGVCIACGRQLTHPDSVAKSIGPVCIKKFVFGGVA